MRIMRGEEWIEYKNHFIVIRLVEGGLRADIRAPNISIVACTMKGKSYPDGTLRYDLDSLVRWGKAEIDYFIAMGKIEVEGGLR